MDPVSVIIPTRDRCAALSRALGSVLAQTLPAAEVIVVDDGSRDSTLELVATRFPEVRLIRQAPAGVSAARNRGIRAARSPWIAFLDSDDRWLPRKLERQLEALRKSSRHRICHAGEVWIRHGRRVNPPRHHTPVGGRIFRECLRRCAIAPSSVVLERDLLDEAGGFDESLRACEDYDLWLRICSRHEVLLVPEPLGIRHEGHADQLSHVAGALDLYRIRALEKIVEDGALGTDDHAAARDELCRRFHVYATGARRRGRTEEASALERRCARLAGGGGSPEGGDLTSRHDPGTGSTSDEGRASPRR